MRTCSEPEKLRELALLWPSVSGYRERLALLMFLIRDGGRPEEIARCLEHMAYDPSKDMWMGFGFDGQRFRYKVSCEGNVATVVLAEHGVPREISQAAVGAQ